MGKSLSKNPITRLKLRNVRKARKVKIVGEGQEFKQQRTKMKAGGDPRKQTRATMGRMSDYAKAKKKKK